MNIWNEFKYRKGTVAFENVTPLNKRWKSGYLVELLHLSAVRTFIDGHRRYGVSLDIPSVYRYRIPSSLWISESVPFFSRSPLQRWSLPIPSLHTVSSWAFWWSTARYDRCILLWLRTSPHIPRPVKLPYQKASADSSWQTFSRQRYIYSRLLRSLSLW